MKNFYKSLVGAFAFVAMAGLSAQAQTYCSPIFSTGCAVGDQIENFSTSNGLTNITNNNSGCSSGSYQHYTTDVLTVMPSSTFDISVQAGSAYSQGHRIWIDWNDDGDFTDSGEDMWNSSTWSTSVYTATLTVPATAVTGQTLRMRVRCSYVSVPSSPCTSQSYGEVEDYDVMVVSPQPDDAGVSVIAGPTNFCEGTEDIKVTIRNFGSNQITSATVNWTFNGVLQTPVSFSGTLDTLFGTGSQTADVTLGSKSFVTGQVESLVAWTSNVNNTTDPDNSNDTLTHDLSPAISGTFTIDSSGNGDYLDFSSAVVGINSYGVCGPVVFNVVNGTYVEQFQLDNIEGTSSTNTVTFQPDANNTGAVKIENSGATSSDNYIIDFVNASYVTIDGFEIEALSSSTGHTLNFQEGSSFNTIKNCILTSPTVSSTSTDAANIYCNSNDISHNNFMYNEVHGGSYSVYFRGSSAGSNIENSFMNNDFVDAYYYSVYLYYQDSYKFNYNSISHTNAAYNWGYGLYSYYGAKSVEVVGNQLSWAGRGAAYFYQTNGTANEQPLIANNWIHSGDGNNYAYGLYFSAGGFTRIVHNTIVKDAFASYGYYGLFINGGANEIYNNIVFEPQGSQTYYALYYSGSFSVTGSNNNNIWEAGNFGYFNGIHSDFSAWKSATNWDTNSTNVDPGYTNYDSLRTCNDTLNNSGMPLEYVTKDIDGDDRDASNPDVGADEWIGSTPGSFSAGEDKIVCVGKTVTVGQAATGGSFSWSTGDTTSTIEVSTAGTYTVTLTTACGANHMDTVEVTDATPVANFTATKSFQTAIFTNNGVNADSYLWVFGDGDSSTAVNPTHLYPSNGPFTACLYVYNECDTAEFCSEVSFSVGIDDVALSNNVSVFPNPAEDIINVSFENVNTDQLNITLLSVQGQEVFAKQYANFDGNSIQTFDVSDMPKGVYFVKITTDSEVLTNRIVVQ